MTLLPSVQACVGRPISFVGATPHVPKSWRRRAGLASADLSATQLATIWPLALSYANRPVHL
jgi:hypothetical protein